MRQKYTKNDALLSKYILTKTEQGKGLPYMTEISKDTGISVATISRYAKRKGFYSFADMRATFNKGGSQSAFNDYGMVDKMLNAKKIVIVASNFTNVLGEYIYSRLNYLKINVSIIREEDFKNEIQNIDKDALIVCISLTGWSLRIEKTIENNKNNEIILITTVKYKPKNKKMIVVPLTEYGYATDEHFEGFKSIRSIYNWLDDCLNILHLKFK